MLHSKHGVCNTCTRFQKMRRTSEDSTGRASRSPREEEPHSEEYVTGSSVASSEGNCSDVEEEGAMQEEGEEKEVEEEEEEEVDEEEEEGDEEEEEYELEEEDPQEGTEQNDYDTRSEASDSQSESVSFSEGESVHSGSGSEASGMSCRVRLLVEKTSFV